MKRIDREGFSGAQIFFLLIIVLLILLTGGIVYALLEMGPQEKPNYVIEDVYFKEGGDGLTADVYLTNIGKTKGKGTLKWEVTKGNRLLDEGQTEFTIYGRTTKKSSLEFQNDGNEEFEIEFKVSHNGEIMDRYSKSVSL